MNSILAAYYDAFNRGDREGMLSFLTDDVIHDLNQGGSEKGIEAFRSFMERMDRCYLETLEEIVIFDHSDGIHAAAEFVVRGKYLSTDAGLPDAHGQTYRLPAGAFFTLRNGKISRVTMYYNLQEWLRQISS